MSVIKIMPCLDMKDGRVVKGIHFVGLKEARFQKLPGNLCLLHLAVLRMSSKCAQYHSGS